MPITDYNGIKGFAVDAKSAQDVYEAIDRMHTQILEKAMEELLDLEEVKA